MNRVRPNVNGLSMLRSLFIKMVKAETVIYQVMLNIQPKSADERHLDHI